MGLTFDYTEYSVLLESRNVNSICCEMLHFCRALCKNVVFNNNIIKKGKSK